MSEHLLQTHESIFLHPFTSFIFVSLCCCFLGACVLIFACIVGKACFFWLTNKIFEFEFVKQPLKLGHGWVNTSHCLWGCNYIPMQHFWGRLRNYRPHKNDTKRPEHLSMNSPDLLCQGVLQMTGSLTSCGYYPFTRYSHLPGFTCGQFEDVYLVIITAKTFQPTHYSDVIMGGMASQITSLASVYSTAYSGIDQRKHQRSASLAFVRGIPHHGYFTGTGQSCMGSVNERRRYTVTSSLIGWAHI